MQILLHPCWQSERKPDWFSGLPSTQQLFLGKWIYHLKLVAADVQLMSCIFYKSSLNKELLYPCQLLRDTAVAVTDTGSVLADRAVTCRAAARGEQMSRCRRCFHSSPAAFARGLKIWFPGFSCNREDKEGWMLLGAGVLLFCLRLCLSCFIDILVFI